MRKRRELILTLILVVGTLVLFGRVRNYEFLNYDDPYYVTENWHVKKGLTKEGIGWAFGKLHGEHTYWHPIAWLSHMLDCELWGVNAGAHHLVNVLFHSVNAMLVFWLMKGMTGAVWRSWLVGALFAWHPLQVDTVAWVTERKNVLSTMFWLLTLVAYVRYARALAVQGSKFEVQGSNSLEPKRLNDGNVQRSTFNVQRVKKWMWYGMAVVFFALGLMSKPMLVTLPCVMLLLDYWPLNRMRSGTTFKVQRIGALILEKLPFLALSAVSAFITIQSHASMGLIGEKMPLGPRIAHAMVSYATYLRKVVWPSDLAVFYPHPGIWPTATVLLSAMVLVAITVVVLWQWRRVPALLVGWSWFLGVLVPTIGIISAGSQAMADRFAYVPLIGLFLLAVWGAGELLVRLPKAALSLTAILALGACVAATSVQLRHWRNSRTLFEHAARVTRENYTAYTIVGSLLAKEGKLDQAIEYYRKSLEFHPDYAATHFNLAEAYSTQKKYEAAIQGYQRAIKLQPSYWQAHLNLARVLHVLERVDEAIPSYREALRLQSDSAEANYFLGKALAIQGNNEEALQLFRETVRLKPKWALAAEKDVANALAQLGRNDEAVAQCRVILSKGPADAEVHTMMAQSLLAMGRADEGVAHYRKAIEIQADVPGTLNNLAWVLATHPKQEIRNGMEAVQLAEKACRLTEYRVPFLLGTLAAAYAEAGRFEDAAEMAKKAAALAREQGQPEVAATNQKLLGEYYARKRPYREEAAESNGR